MATAIENLRASRPVESLIAPGIGPDGDSLFEVVDGKFVEKSMGSNEEDLANWLADFLGDFARPRRLGRVVVEMLFLLDERRDLKRRPDAAFVSAARWPETNSASEAKGRLAGPCPTWPSRL